MNIMQSLFKAISRWFSKPQDTMPIPTPVDSKNNTKISLHTGMNKYVSPISQLRGCVKDANDFFAILKSLGFSSTLLTDSQCSKTNILNTMKALTSSLTSGSKFVWTNSSHGSQIGDANGDEPDRKDEVIVTIDGNTISDDEIRAILNPLIARGVSVDIISDSCHSATLTRMLEESLDDDRTPRWVNPALLGKLPKNDSKAATPLFMGETEMGEILLSGCLATEYSYDATINGQNCGAMSYYATATIKASPKITWNQLYASIRKNLPSSKYPQTPQLEGKDENKNKQIFT